jgi:hypothetical protein
MAFKRTLEGQDTYSEQAPDNAAKAYNTGV